MIRAGLKTETPVVACRLFIDSVDEQADTASLGMNSLCSGQGINQQQLAKALAMMPLVDGQTAQPHARNAPWQLFAPGLWQVAVFEFGER